MKKFDNTISDSQAIKVELITPEIFDFDLYANYTQELNKKCKAFWNAPSGVIVYRRMRVAECFSFGCRDMKNSLANQLGALQTSMKFKADVSNFLEPWYGIGTIASAFGGDYIWHEGNAPALETRFQSIDEILNYTPTAICNTNIGRQTLEMIDYFVHSTLGKIPISFTDSQSPLNMVGHLMPLDNFFIEMMTAPEKVLQLFDILANLSIDFNKEQQKRIGENLVLPGHGFASSYEWSGLGVSDDNILMISPEQYIEFVAPSVEKICKPFGGPVFHSCGNWAGWIDAVLKIQGLKMTDGAFSPQTDPSAIDDLEAFQRFANTGIILNTRMVGDIATIEKQVRRLWVPGMKLVVVTYCQTPDEQTDAYHLIHDICKD